MENKEKNYSLDSLPTPEGEIPNFRDKLDKKANNTLKKRKAEFEHRKEEDDYAFETNKRSYDEDCRRETIKDNKLLRRWVIIIGSTIFLLLFGFIIVSLICDPSKVVAEALLPYFAQVLSVFIGGLFGVVLASK